MNSYGTPYNYNGMNYNYGNMPMQNYQPQFLQQKQMEKLQALESQNNQTNSNMGQFAWVNGYVGAQAYIIPPNSMITLLDSDADYMYVKQSDQNGKTVIQKFKLVKEDVESSNVQTFDDTQYVKKEYFDNTLGVLQKELRELQSSLGIETQSQPKVKKDSQPKKGGEIDG